MDELVRWLGEQLDEDERIARAATAGPWLVDCESYAEAIIAGDGTSVIAGGRWGGEASAFESTEDALHIAAHDPARVLREIDAKRRIVDRFAWLREHGDTGGTEWVIPVLALAYEDRPGYREEWRP